MLMGLPMHRGPGVLCSVRLMEKQLLQHLQIAQPPPQTPGAQLPPPETPRLCPALGQMPQGKLQLEGLCNWAGKGSWTNKWSPGNVCVCADAGTRDCLSFFLEPELKFTRVINGLASR